MHEFLFNAPQNTVGIHYSEDSPLSVFVYAGCLSFHDFRQVPRCCHQVQEHPSLCYLAGGGEQDGGSRGVCCMYWQTWIPLNNVLCVVLGPAVDVDLSGVHPGTLHGDPKEGPA